MVRGLLYKDECYRIVGLCIRVHNKLGHGFADAVYKDAVEQELKIDRGIPYERGKSITIMYGSTLLPNAVNVDFYLFRSIILDVKADRVFPQQSFDKTFHLLKASRVELAVLANFGTPKLEFKRVICTR